MKIGLPALALLLIATIAAAQPPPRVRGVVQAVEGQTLVVATPNEGVVRLTLTDMTGINGLEKRTIADITDNTFIGTTAVKNRDGRWEATEVHIFPESMRGAGEGHYAWDLPDSTMTNGAATGVVAKGRGGSMNVRHAGGSVEIAVTRRTQIVGLTMGSPRCHRDGACGADGWRRNGRRRDRGDERNQATDVTARLSPRL
jgi:hypothetical protein